jgi:PAS domain S-box-containing protein
MKDKITDTEKMVFSADTPATHWLALTKTLLNVTGHHVFVVDENGLIVLADSAAKKSFRATAKTPLKSLLPDLEPLITKTLSDKKSRMDVPVQFNSNSVLVSISPIRPGTLSAGAVCVLKENTGRKTSPRQMQFFQDTTRELDAIIDSSSDGLFVCDANANVIRVNPASERIHKIKAAEVIGKNMVDLINEGFIDRSAALEAGRQKKTVSLLQDKENRKLISTGTPVFDNKGNLIRVVVSERDITEIDTLQRRLEEQAALKDQFQHQLLELQQADLKTQNIIARSPTVVKTLEQALKVSRVNSSVLITGESGVGKGLVARLIHKNSHRAEKPLIRINCGAIPETLVESELFGYAPGAFTGAQTGGKPGHLEIAHGGTLFLDEIAELPLQAQVKLLRFLEDGRLTRIGESKVRTVDARILTATHRNLMEMVKNGSFRHDLYYRLNVIPLHVPALRERKECILPLIRHYIDHFAEISNIARRLSRSAIDALMIYPYPGNVRELMNICERAVVMSETEVIDFQDLPPDIQKCTEPVETPPSGWHGEQTLEQILQNVERRVLVETLKTHGNQSMAAAALGVSQPTIARRLKKYGIRQQGGPSLK